MTTAHQVTVAADKAAQAAVAHKAADEKAAHKATASETTASRAAAEADNRPLSKEQKAEADRLAAAKKADDERIAAEAKAKADFEADVHAAVLKRNKALEKYTSPDLNGIVCEAYEATKGPGDPLFADVILPHRDNLRTWADSVIRTGLVGENPSDFEKKVAELLTKKEYKDLGRQNTGAWGASEARDNAADYEGDENEKGVIQKNTKADTKAGEKSDVGKADHKK